MNQLIFMELNLLDLVLTTDDDIITLLSNTSLPIKFRSLYNNLLSKHKLWQATMSQFRKQCS